MKKLIMCAFYDKKSKRYDTPFFTLDEIGAKRAFIVQCRNQKTVLSQFKDDFLLEKLGEFDVESGLFKDALDNHGKAVVLIEGLQVNIEKEEK